MSVRRFERVDFVPSAEVQADGFMRVSGKVARTGIQIYHDANGKERRELRMPEDVKASVPGFALAPLTNSHPPEMVTPQNAKRYVSGAVGAATFDNDGWVTAPITVYDASAIAAVKAGRAQLSVGYQCEVLDEAGEWNGEKYDSRQTNIIVNHVALVDVARAGPQARLKLDSGDAVHGEVNAIACDTTNPIGSKSSNGERLMHKFKIDAFEIEVADANAQAIIENAINAARKDAADKAKSEAAKDLTEMTAKHDVLDGKVKELTEAAKALPKLIADGIEEVCALRADADKHGVDVSKCGADKMAIRKAVIAKLSPTMKIDGKDDGYVMAVYDNTIAMAPAPVTPIDKARAGHLDANVTDSDKSPEAARQRMIARKQAALVK